MKKHKILAWRLLSVLVVLTMLLPATFFVAPMPVTQAADTGWRSPSADAADTGGDGDGFENNPTYAYASGGDYASNQDGPDDNHRYYNFGFDSVIPTDAAINGIEVRLDGWADSTDNSPRYDVDLSWDGGSSWSDVLHSTSTLADSQTTSVLGDQNDLWDSEHTWSASDLSNANFRVRITARAFNAGSEDRDFFLDWVAVRVYYASAHINGTVWADDNANGVQDGGETGLNNIHVTIYQDDGDDTFEGGGQDPEVGSDDTDTDGAYDTGPFMDGNSYWIEVDTPANRYLTTPPEPRLVYLPDGNPVTVNFGYAPLDSAIEIAKTPDPQMVVSGGTAIFTIAITNTGDVTLTDVVVSDIQASDCVRAAGQLPNLDPDASTSYECNQPNVLTDFTNSATATGTPPIGDDVTDTDTAAVIVIDPDIQIAKTPDTQTVVRGSTVTFTIAVTNTGDVTLEDVNVTDAQAPDCARVIGELTPEGSTSYASYECTLASVTDSFVNVATVTGSPPAGGDVTAIDTASVNVIAPAIEIAKTPEAQTVLYNSTATFTIAVANTGDVALTNVTVSDDLAPNCAATLGTLAAEDSTSYECTLGNVLADFTNSATVTGTPPIGDDVIDTDTAFVDVIAPAIAIAKTPGTQMVASGTAANFTIAVTNTGDVVLTNVAVSDAQAPDCDAGPTTLGIGLSWSYSCAVDDVTDGFINSAIVTGRPSVGNDVTDADAAKVRLDETQPCPADMIAYWKLDETGSPTYDDFYDGHDGECAGSCPVQAPGHINGGQEFDGSTTGIDVPAVPGDDSFNWSVDGSFSIEFWMQTDSASTCAGNQVIVGRDDSSNGLHWWTGCRDGGPAGFSLRDTDGNLATLTGITDLTDGLWHHIVAVRDADEDEIRIYVDGTAEDSESTTYSAGFASLTAAVNVGHLLGGYHFDGVVDEVALYERALPSDEVRQHYNEGLAERWYCQSGAYAPIIVSPPVTAATVGRPYLYDVEAAGDPAPTYALVVSPTGMTIDTLTGLISWTPMIAQEGNHNVQVQASNSEGTDTQNFTIIVQEGTLCPADMIAYWKLDETSDDSAYDDFYDGHDGECAGDCPTPVAGHVNGGQAFSSTTGIDVPADAAFNWGSNDSFSIEFWMQTDSASTCTGNQVIVGRDDSANGLHWWTGCRDGGPAGFSLGDTSGYLVMLTGITDLTDGFWHHIVAVRDADEDEIRIYVDGTEEDSEPATYSAGFSSLAAAVNIGWLNLLGGFHFDGTVDEVALYDRALAEDEVQQHYNDGEAGPGYCINPDIAVNKTADPPVAYVSDTVIYTYTVTNPGDDPLGVSLTDDRCSPVTFTEGDDDSDDKLDPTEAWVYACSMTLTTDITNVATVTGAHSLGGTVNHTDTVSVNVISPAIALDKVADPTLIYAGDTVIYTYTVTNPGDDPLSVATPNDDQCEPVSFVGGDGNLNYKLDPGETWAYTCSTIVSADITNTATVTGTDSAGGTVSVADTAFVDVINPAITISKTPDSQMVRYDSMATFTIAVTNTGDAALTNVTVSDDLAPDCGQTVGTLEAGEYHTYTCTVANVTADFTNSATVIGTDPLNGTVIITDTAFVDVISPAITIAKTPDSQMVRHNSTATFTIAITNTGDAVLTNVNILDTLAPNCEQTVSTLAAGTNLTYSCTVANVTADFTNSATAIGTPPVGPDVSDTDTASVDVINPDIAIAKTPDAQTVRSDSMVTFTIAVTNTGDTALENVTVSDPLVPNCEQTVSTLAVGENHTYPCAVANVTADFTNSATATGTPPVGPDVSDTDTALVDVINPDVAIAKTPDAQTVRSGSTVTFTIAVTNTGDAALTNVTVSDGLAPNCGKAVGLLTAEDSLAYTCTITDVTADFLNSATVTGTPPVGPDVSDTDTAFVDVINPYIEIAKMPDTQTTIGGSTVTFSIVVTNTSDVTLTSVSISDPLAPDCEQTLDEMIAGDSHTYVCTRANVMADFINIATVTATPPVGPEVSDTDIASVYVINPDIQIAKTPDSQMVRYNSTATFTIAITNTSDAPLSNVTVSDILAPNCTQTVGTLAAGENHIHTCAIANVTDDFTNSATVIGTPPVGPDVSDTDEASVNVISPTIEIAKTPDAQTVPSGSTVTFTIAITNTGDAILSDVTISDSLAPNCGKAVGTLTTGNGLTYTCTITDVTADFTNSATVTGTPPVGPDVSDTDTASVYVEGPEEERHTIYLPIIFKFKH